MAQSGIKLEVYVIRRFHGMRSRARPPTGSRSEHKDAFDGGSALTISGHR